MGPVGSMIESAFWAELAKQLPPLDPLVSMLTEVLVFVLAMVVIVCLVWVVLYIFRDLGPRE